MDKKPQLLFYETKNYSASLHNSIKFFIISESNDDFLDFVNKSNLPDGLVFWCDTEEDADKDIPTNLKKGISIVKIFLDK